MYQEIAAKKKQRFNFLQTVFEFYSKFEVKI